jgi:hypothetical protein
MEQMTHAVSLNFGRVFDSQMLWLESLDQLLQTAAAPNAAGDVESSTTIGVPLKVPADLREMRREQQAGPFPAEGDISLA